MASRFRYDYRMKRSRDNLVLGVVFLLIFILESMFFREETSASVRGAIAFAISFLYAFFICKVRIINKRVLHMLMIMLFVRCLNWVFYGINTEYDIYNIVIWTIAALFVSSISFEKFSKAYIKVLSSIGLVSSILFVVRIVYPRLLSYLPVYRGWHGDGVFTNAILGICDLSSNNVRNYGVFYEPGLHGIFQCIALYILLFREEKINLFYLICISLGILTSLSTNGLISAFFLVIAYIFDSNVINIRQKKNILRCLVTGIILLIIYLYKNPHAFSYLFGKFSEMRISSVHSMNSTDVGSGYERLRSVVYSAQILVLNPLFGCGWQAFIEKFNNIISTFTPLNWLCLYGWPVGIMLNYYYVRYEIKCKRNPWSKTLLILFMFTLIMTQNLYNDVIIIIFILYNVNSSNLSKNYKMEGIQHYGEKIY